jgi:hypothetical protein
MLKKRPDDVIEVLPPSRPPLNDKARDLLQQIRADADKAIADPDISDADKRRLKQDVELLCGPFGAMTTLLEHYIEGEFGVLLLSATISMAQTIGQHMNPVTLEKYRNDAVASMNKARQDKAKKIDDRIRAMRAKGMPVETVIKKLKKQGVTVSKSKVYRAKTKPV